MLPVRSARTPEFESECISGVGATVTDRRAVAVSARGGSLGSAQRCGGPPGRNFHDRVRRHTPPMRNGQFLDLTGRLYVWGPRRDGNRFGVGLLHAAALRAAVPAPTGRTGRRSAFPCRRRQLVWLAFRRGCIVTAARGRRSRAGAPPFPAGVRAETSTIRKLGDTRFARRPAGGPDLEGCDPSPARRRADRRSAFPAVTTRVQRKNPGAGWPRGSG